LFPERIAEPPRHRLDRWAQDVVAPEARPGVAPSTLTHLAPRLRLSPQELLVALLVTETREEAGTPAVQVALEQRVVLVPRGQVEI